MTPHRYFLALLPDTEARAALQALPLPPGARKVHPDDLHLTLAFLGDLKAASPQTLLGALALPDLAAIAVRLERWEVWAGPRLACATGTAPAAAALAAALAQQLPAWGYRAADRPFRPHVTLARGLSRTAMEAPARSIDPPIHWTSPELVLCASAAGPVDPGSARYTVYARRPIGG